MQILSNVLLTIKSLEKLNILTIFCKQHNTRIDHDWITKCKAGDNVSGPGQITYKTIKTVHPSLQITNVNLSNCKDAADDVLYLRLKTMS